MSLLFLLSCVSQPGTKDSSERPPDDSGGEDTAGTEPLVASGVPGWDDYDCSEPSPGRTLVVEFPDVYSVVGEFYAGLPAAGPQTLLIQLRDCVLFPCTEEALDATLPNVDVQLDGTGADGGLTRGLGEWGPDDLGVRVATGSGLSPIDAWSDGETGTASAVTACLERVRPDEVRGVVRVESFWSETQEPFHYQFYDSLVRRFPFDVRFADHAGFDTTRPDAPEARPEGYSTAHFVYDVPYADAWPWASITDPTIRGRLFDEFTPYNEP